MSQAEQRLQPTEELPRLEWCVRCDEEQPFEEVDAWDDGTNRPPTRLACAVCGCPPGPVAIL